MGNFDHTVKDKTLVSIFAAGLLVNGNKWAQVDIQNLINTPPRSSLFPRKGIVGYDSVKAVRGSHLKSVSSILPDSPSLIRITASELIPSAAATRDQFRPAS
ncbi:hypothetical protein MaudCBS49596_007530 [Microsporum audouinii]